jgi:lysophospholipase L1-like esterase
MPRVPRRTLTRRQKVLLIVVPVVLLFGTLEAIQRVRYAVRQQNVRWLAYGVSQRYAAVDSVAVMNDIEAQLARIDGRRRYIACVGGSTTLGIYNAPAQRFPSVLNRLIDGRGGADRFVVLNLGRAGVSSADYGDVIEPLLRAVTPAAVIVYAGYNDVFITPAAGISRTLFSHALIGLERVSLLALTAHEKILISRLNDPRGLLTPERVREIEADLRRNLTAHVQRLRHRGIPVVLVPEVVIAKHFGATRNYERYAEPYRGIPAVFRDVAAAHGAEYVSVQDAFERDDFREDFVDPVHFTAQGNERLARLLLERSRTLRSLVD